MDGRVECRLVPVLNTGHLPPFWYEGQWRAADDEVANLFVLPSASCLYRTWICALESVVLSPGHFGTPAPSSMSDGLPLAFGVKVWGRIRLSRPVVSDLLALAARSATLRSIRLPAFW